MQTLSLGRRNVALFLNAANGRTGGAFAHRNVQTIDRAHARRKTSAIRTLLWIGRSVVRDPRCNALNLGRPWLG